MAINLGLTGFTKIYLGSTEISKVYLGTDLVFGSTDAAQYLWNYEDSLTDDIGGLTLTQGNPMTYVTGKVGKGIYNVSGNTNIATTTNATLCAMLSNRNAYSIASWVKVEPSASDFFRPLKHGNAGFSINTATTCYYYVRASASQYTVTTSFTKNVFHHLVYTYDGTNIKVYFDGQLKDTRADSASPTITGLAMITTTTGGGGAKGVLDITRVYNYALSLAEVQALYNI